MCLCTATAYGKGVYFAKFFAYSAQHVYSPPDKNEHKHVFQCQVLTGHFHKGYPNLLEPPVMNKKSLCLYNSVVDCVKHPSIFVVFHDNQAYPEYLITFLSNWLSIFLNICLLQIFTISTKRSLFSFPVKIAQITADYWYIAAHNVSRHSTIKCACISTVTLCVLTWPCNHI